MSLNKQEFNLPTNWNTVQISDILTLGGGKDYKHLKKGDIPVYGTGGYMTSVNEYLYDGESVGIGRKGTIDKPVFLTGKFWTVDTLFYTHSFKNVIPYFVYLVFQSINWRKYSEATGVPSLSKNIIEPIKILLPPLPEQQKIAEILSIVDEKIEVIDQQITETQELKKGLMQRLLTKGIAHSEFKDSPLGKIPKSWEVVRCDSIADITSSKRVYLSDYTVCGIPFFRGKEITQLSKGEKLNDLVYIKEDTFIEFKNRFGAPKEGDILITAVGTIGSIYMVNSTDNFYFKDGNLMWLREIDSRLNRQFITHYFRSIIFQNLIDIISSGSSQKALTIVKFKLLPVVIPPLDEQIKISKILDVVYEKLEVLAEKKVNYQELKQGLMQQLLTGKIRVKV